MRTLPRCLLLLVALLAVWVVTVHAATGSYTCGGAGDNPIESGDANWSKLIAANGAKSQSNVCQTISGTPAVYLYNIATTADQFSKLTANDNTGGNGGPMLRMAVDGADGRGYFAYITATTVQIYKRSGGSNSNACCAVYSITLVANDVFELRATGDTTTTFDVLKNNVSLGTRSDSSSAFTTGKAGFYNAGQQFSNWQGGDYAAGGGGGSSGRNLSLMGVGALLYFPSLQPVALHRAPSVP